MIKEKAQKRNLKRKVLTLITLIGVIGALVFAYIRLDKEIPDNINITLNKDEEFYFDLPMEGEVQSSRGVLNINNKKVPTDQIKLNLKDPFTLKATEFGNYQINLKLFGFINFKKVNVDVVENIELIPAGKIIGIYIETNGIMVLGTGSVSSEDGLNYEPALNKIRTGDYITSINGEKIKHKEDLIDVIDKSKGEELILQLRRNNEIIESKIKPVKTVSGEYKIGVWIRDDTQGLGTLTFITETGEFGALGHAITDVDTSQIIEVGQGNIYNAKVMSIVKGNDGNPGELIGLIAQDDENIIGDITKNTSQGIFGEIGLNYNQKTVKALPVGLKQDIYKGKATILSCVDGEILEYDIIIEDITLGGSNSNKGIVIQITDDELLNKSGGIVQGMSGSPIIQDEKIIGAVTHVFIQDSTKGYGTFIENMIFNID